MNRVIKFRGKNMNGTNWLYGSLIVWPDGDTYIASLKHNELSDVMPRYDVDPKTIGQFTGLYDADGKEIYEGDIIESKFGGDKPVRHFVGYNTKEAAFTSELIGEFPNSGSIRQSWIDEFGKKVIGNIYDNPEHCERR